MSLHPKTMNTWIKTVKQAGLWYSCKVARAPRETHEDMGVLKQGKIMRETLL